LLGPGDQVVREVHDLQPHLVVLELSEREVSESGVLVVADLVLGTGAGAVVTFDLGDLAGVVGQDRLEAVPVGVGERELRPGMRALLADDHPAPRRPRVQVEVVGDLAHLPVRSLLAVLIEGRFPVGVGDLEDRRADRSVRS
jgi:hypothetical protein